MTPDELASYPFPAGSMGPKVSAAVEFATLTGRLNAVTSCCQQVNATATVLNQTLLASLPFLWGAWAAGAGVAALGAAVLTFLLPVAVLRGPEREDSPGRAVLIVS